MHTRNGFLLPLAVTAACLVSIVVGRRACEEYALEHGGCWPASLLELCIENADGNSYLSISAPPLDPWKWPYRYEPPDAEFDEPRIWTFGKDGLPGGADDDADVGSWMFRW